LAELEWSDFKVILALSRGGSLARAARNLDVDSSTVSRRLAALEESLGATLVLRGGREFSFTPEGKSVLEAAQAIEAAVLSAKTSITAAKQNVEGVVRISCVGSFYHVLSPLSQVLRQKHPNLLVEIDDSDRLVNLAAGEADIAIRMVAPTEPDLVVRKAFDLGWCIYASKDYAAHYGLPSTPEELRQHRLILYHENRLHLEGFNWLEQFKSGKGSYARVNITSVALRAAISGAGIVALPAYEGAEHMSLIRVFPDPFYLQPSYLVFHEILRDSVRIRTVIDDLMEFLASKKQMLRG